MAFTDNFTDTDGTELQNHTPSGGTAWTRVNASNGAFIAVIRSNGIGRDSGAGSGRTAYHCDDQGSNDHYSQGTQPGSNNRGDTFCAVRVVDADNFVGWWVAGTGAAGSRMSKCISGTITDLVTFQGAANAVTKVEAEGDTFRIYKDTVQQGTDQTVTGLSTTRQGVVQGIAQTGGATDVKWDDFEADALAGGGAVSGSAAQTLPAITQSASANLIFTATADQTLASLTQSATGDISNFVHGGAAQTLPSMTQSASGSLKFSATTTQTLPAITQAATATGGAAVIRRGVVRLISLPLSRDTVRDLSV